MYSLYGYCLDFRLHNSANCISSQNAAAHASYLLQKFSLALNKYARTKSNRNLSPKPYRKKYASRNVN